jgi:valyl-tRNA synthetase
MKCKKCAKEFQQPVPNATSAPAAEPPMGPLDSKRFEKGRNFSNKVWNAGRFVLTGIDANFQQAIQNPAEIEKHLRDEDKWILSRLNRAIQDTTTALDNFEFSKATNALYAFFWDEFCAWTIELSKPRLAPDADPKDRAAAQAVLVYALDRSLRLLHPFCPFISEVLWAELAKVAPTPESRNLGYPPMDDLRSGRPFVGPLIAGSCWPRADIGMLKPDVEAQFGAVFEAVRAVRNIRQKNGIQPKERLKVRIKTAATDAGTAASKNLASQKHILQRMAGIETPEIGPEIAKPKPAGTEMLQGAELYVDLAGLIDPEKEKARLDKEITFVNNAVQQGQNKLADEKFAKNAPADKVEAERARLAEYQTKLAGLQAARKELD